MFKKIIFTLVICLMTSNVLLSQSAVKLNGTSQYIRSTNNSSIRLTRFTLECWFYIDGVSLTTSTGSGGVTAIPLITRGRGEAEQAAKDVNYFLGIRPTDSVLVADFENNTNSGNHPVAGVTKVKKNQWQHAAVTYDGTTWRLYLNGVLDRTLTVSRTPQSASTQNLAFGSSLNSTNTAEGFFNGKIDEIRIWNAARTATQISSNYNLEVLSGTGLVGRWSLNENSGIVAVNTGTGGTAVNGTLMAGATWVPGFNAPVNTSPVISNPNPANGATGVTGNDICVTVNDAENNPMSVKFYGRRKPTGNNKFTVIYLPDTQFYTSELNGGSNSIFKAQTNWIVANKDALNIVYVNQLGDCVEHGDNGGNDIEWRRADTSMKIIEDPVTTNLPQGIPYGICVGNHDQSPLTNPLGTTIFYNQYFGEGRFSGRNYYGGHYGVNNDNHYQLFSAGGFDFISINLEYAENISANTALNASVLHWADSLLKANSNRKAIINSHWLINANGTWSSQGQLTYDSLKDNTNIFLMACGHVPGGEAMRSDTYNGNTIYTVLSDYQSWTNGGNGYLRIMEFDANNNSVSVKTYSPTLNVYETDANSQFSIPFNGISQYALIAENLNVANGSSCVTWNGLETDSTYEWYTVVNDGTNTAISPVWSFTKGANAPRQGIVNTTELFTDMSNEKGLKIFPNPSPGKFQLMFPEFLTDKLSVIIYGNDGKVVFKKQYQAGQKSYEVDSGLKPGVYLLQASPGILSWSRKIVIN
jgi:hypothetical protein